MLSVIHRIVNMVILGMSLATYNKYPCYDNMVVVITWSILMFNNIVLDRPPIDFVFDVMFNIIVKLCGLISLFINAKFIMSSTYICINKIWTPIMIYCLVLNTIIDFRIPSHSNKNIIVLILNLFLWIALTIHADVLKKICFI